MSKFSTVGSRNASRDALWTPLLFAAWIAGAAFVAWHLNEGWIPHDDPAFAESAQRVLDGQLPHRDFDEIYTGGLTFLNAGIFGLFGENVLWLRIPMFALFVAYVPCVYAIARYFAPRSVAALGAFFAVAWGPATYPAAMPSWYLLFFSTFGTLALLRFLGTEYSLWLVGAGVCGGLAISFKIVGVWFVLAVVLFLLFVEQEARSKRAWRLSVGAYGVVVMAIALLSWGLVLALMLDHLGGAELGNLLVPLAAVCGLVIVNELRVDEPNSRARLSAAFRLLWPFALGVAGPIVLLILPYVITGSVGDLVSGVLVQPRLRLHEAYGSTPSPVALIVAAPLVVGLVGRRFVPGRTRRVIDLAGVSIMTLLLVTSATYPSHVLLWVSARELAPFISLVGCAALALVAQRSTDPALRRGTFLLLALATFASLIQFPFAGAIYFCYGAPLFMLAAIALHRYMRSPGLVLPVVLLVAYSLFGIVWLTRDAIYRYPVSPRANPHTVILDSHRASIKVTPAERDMYRGVLGLVRLHASGRYIFAGPDAPEVYFLAARRNPTRSTLTFLDTSGDGQGARLLRTLRARGVTAVVVNLQPALSGALDPLTLRLLRTEYPTSTRVGRFEIRWR